MRALCAIVQDRDELVMFARKIRPEKEVGEDELLAAIQIMDVRLTCVYLKDWRSQDLWRAFLSRRVLLVIVRRPTTTVR